MTRSAPLVLLIVIVALIVYEAATGDVSAVLGRLWSWLGVPHSGH